MSACRLSYIFLSLIIRLKYNFSLLLSISRISFRLLHLLLPYFFKISADSCLFCIIFAVVGFSLAATFFPHYCCFIVALPGCLFPHLYFPNYFLNILDYSELSFPQGWPTRMLTVVFREISRISEN